MNPFQWESVIHLFNILISCSDQIENSAKGVLSSQFPDLPRFSLGGAGQSYLPRTPLHLMNSNIFRQQDIQ